jgi:hypothetical protein
MRPGWRYLVSLVMVAGCVGGWQADNEHRPNTDNHSPAPSTPARPALSATGIPVADETVKPGLGQEQNCSDPVHCDGSEEANPVDVDGPVIPETGWQPPVRGADIPCNGLDEAGDGADNCPVDADADGTVAEFDCDDHDPSRHVAAPEMLCDGIDQNCDGVDVCDADGDGFLDTVDCDDTNPLIGPDECNDTPPSDPDP